MISDTHCSGCLMMLPPLRFRFACSTRAFSASGGRHAAGRALYFLMGHHNARDCPAELLPSGFLNAGLLSERMRGAVGIASHHMYYSPMRSPSTHRSYWERAIKKCDRSSGSLGSGRYHFPEYDFGKALPTFGACRDNTASGCRQPFKCRH
jgi:hypothetical protein